MRQKLVFDWTKVRTQRVAGTFFDEGMKAKSEGKTKNTNPYQFAKNEWYDWNDGYEYTGKQCVTAPVGEQPSPKS